MHKKSNSIDITPSSVRFINQFHGNALCQAYADFGLIKYGNLWNGTSNNIQTKNVGDYSNQHLQSISEIIQINGKRTVVPKSHSDYLVRGNKESNDLKFPKHGMPEREDYKSSEIILLSNILNDTSRLVTDFNTININNHIQSTPNHQNWSENGHYDCIGIRQPHHLRCLPKSQSTMSHILNLVGRSNGRTNSDTVSTKCEFLKSPSERSLKSFRTYCQTLFDTVKLRETSYPSTLLIHDNKTAVSGKPDVLSPRSMASAENGPMTLLPHLQIFRYDRQWYAVNDSVLAVYRHLQNIERLRLVEAQVLPDQVIPRFLILRLLQIKNSRLNINLIPDQRTKLPETEVSQKTTELLTSFLPEGMMIKSFSQTLKSWKSLLLDKSKQLLLNQENTLLRRSKSSFHAKEEEGGEKVVMEEYCFDKLSSDGTFFSNGGESLDDNERLEFYDSEEYSFNSASENEDTNVNNFQSNSTDESDLDDLQQ